MLGVKPLMRPEIYHNSILASEIKVLKFVLNKACPIICNLAVGSEFCQIGKKLYYNTDFYFNFKLSILQVARN